MGYLNTQTNIWFYCLDWQWAKLALRRQKMVTNIKEQGVTRRGPVDEAEVLVYEERVVSL